MLSHWHFLLGQTHSLKHSRKLLLQISFKKRQYKKSIWRLHSRSRDNAIGQPVSYNNNIPTKHQQKTNFQRQRNIGSKQKSEQQLAANKDFLPLINSGLETFRRDYFRSEHTAINLLVRQNFFHKKSSDDLSIKPFDRRIDLGKLHCKSLLFSIYDLLDMSQYEELSALSLSKLRKAIKKQEYMSPFHLLSPANLNGKARVDYLACLKNQKAESALAGSLNDPLEEACLCLKSNRAQSAPKYISAILNNLPKKNKYYREVIRAEKMFIVKGLLAILLEKFQKLSAKEYSLKVLHFVELCLAREDLWRHPSRKNTNFRELETICQSILLLCKNNHGKITTVCLQDYTLMLQILIKQQQIEACLQTKQILLDFPENKQITSLHKPADNLSPFSKKDFNEALFKYINQITQASEPPEILQPRHIQEFVLGIFQVFPAQSFSCSNLEAIINFVSSKYREDTQAASPFLQGQTDQLLSFEMCSLLTNLIKKVDQSPEKSITIREQFLDRIQHTLNKATEQPHASKDLA